MLREVFSSPLNGCIASPPSKSYAHRLLILNAFRNSTSSVLNTGDSEDVKATINSLTELGSNLVVKDGGVFFSQYDKNTQSEQTALVDVGESGSTFRFILPLICVLGKTARIICHGRLKERPHDSFFNALMEHGVQIKSIPEGYEVTGTLKGDHYVIDSTISSQYITGLLLSLPYLERECTVQLKGEPVSKSYLKITNDVLNTTGVNYSFCGDTYKVNGFSDSCSHQFFVEGDWSGASFFVVAGALSEKGIAISSLNVNSMQGDRQILDVVKEFGAEVEVRDDSIFIKKGSSIRPVSVDLDNMIDSVPILSVLASFASGVSEFSGIERLRFKESDRIMAVINMLTAAGVTSEYKDKKLYIHGSTPHSGNFNGENDHRMVMAASILASSVNDTRPSYISTPYAVKKSYPAFFEDLQKIGGISRVKMDR